MSSNALDGEHLRVKDKAMEHFVGRRKMGGAEFSEKYKERLEQVCLFTLSLNCSLLE
jgi:atlastin